MEYLSFNGDRLLADLRAELTADQRAAVCAVLKACPSLLRTSAMLACDKLTTISMSQRNALKVLVLTVPLQRIVQQSSIRDRLFDACLNHLAVREERHVNA
jgi:anti-sigma factor RsiW